MNEEKILFQYQVKTKSQYGKRFYYFYADTDIENYLNNKNIKYVRYAKDTALNKKEKRIKELFKESKHYKHIIDEIEKYIHNELVLDFYNDDMPCELIINKMEKMIKELKEGNNGSI